MKAFLDVSANAAPIDYKRARECFGDKKDTFYTKVRGIKEQVKKGRYNRYSVIEDSRTAVNYFVYWDYSVYRKRLENEFECKRVPPFDINLIAEITPVMVEHHFYE